ncbi:unnamed protein product [Cyprideis torosa]|uniref:Uncharacterized protein n=1 Tax=Cyprideis torosa TaxID=163714 RepID=A0A7R8WFU5_9CRUS|nr:unnamed protein product [Cyprideis torosa]CAG0897427.1 unnamed protein product [Cyprideis torosa]
MILQLLRDGTLEAKLIDGRRSHPGAPIQRVHHSRLRSRTCSVEGQFPHVELVWRGSEDRENDDYKREQPGVTADLSSCPGLVGLGRACPFPTRSNLLLRRRRNSVLNLCRFRKVSSLNVHLLYHDGASSADHGLFVVIEARIAYVCPRVLVGRMTFDSLCRHNWFVWDQLRLRVLSPKLRRSTSLDLLHLLSEFCPVCLLRSFRSDEVGDGCHDVSPHPFAVLAAVFLLEQAVSKGRKSQLFLTPTATEQRTDFLQHPLRHPVGLPQPRLLRFSLEHLGRFSLKQTFDVVQIVATGGGGLDVSIVVHPQKSSQFFQIRQLLADVEVLWRQQEISN